MRLFTAIVLSDAAKNEIFQLVCNMKQNAVRGNFTRRENLHVTLVFLGEVADSAPVAPKTAFWNLQMMCPTAALL